MSEKIDQVKDGALEEVSGGKQNTAPCECLFCRSWITPELRGGKPFCPVCGMQVGGTLNGGKI